MSSLGRIPSRLVHGIPFKTNKYVRFCTTEPAEGEKDVRRDHQRAKKRRQGFTTLSDPAFEVKHVYGMIGITITMGLTQKTRMRKHWSTSPFDNYPLVMKCMGRDVFELLYCRFLHCSDANAPSRLRTDGSLNPDYDSKWHIR